jgi:hypothetical protein
MAGVPDQVALDIKIQFLDNVVIPSFDVEPPHENKSARSEWLRNRAAHYGEHLEDLMLLANVHDTYESNSRKRQINWILRNPHSTTTNK